MWDAPENEQLFESHTNPTFFSEGLPAYFTEKAMKYLPT